MEHLRVDAFSPDKIAKKLADISTKKSGLDLFRMFVLAIFAGVFISFGAEFFTLVIHDSNLPVGLTKLVGGLVFCIGLILIVLAGAELFTGNTLMVMGFAEGLITTRGLLRNWGIVLLGNLIGSLAMVFLMYLSDQWTVNHYKVGAKALAIANGKVNLPFLTAFVRGILCNTLVVLAVWLCMGARTTVDKIMAIIFPITAFVASGFEHCVANMYFIPMGLALKSNPEVLTAAGYPDISNLNLYGFFVRNLLPVTLGNIIGGSFFVGLAYWSVYLRDFSFSSLWQLGRLGLRLLFLVPPKDAAPTTVSTTLSGFYGVISKKKPGGRPLPRDLSAVGETEKKEMNIKTKKDKSEDKS